MKPVVLPALVAVVCTWASCYHSAPTKMTRLPGLTEARVINKLGPPERSSVFPVGEGQPEFRVELLNFYPPSNSANHDVLIKELLWREGEYHQAVWFHQVNGEWRALDSVRWHKDIQFRTYALDKAAATYGASRLSNCGLMHNRLEVTFSSA